MPVVEFAPERVVQPPQSMQPDILIKPPEPAYQIKVDSDFSNMANYPQFELPEPIKQPQPVYF